MKIKNMQEILNKELYKEVCEHYELYYKLQPLTARIYALFVFNNCPNGLTFEDILDTFQASKSSVSHSINTLVELNFLEQFKKDNERKRHFRVNRSLFLMRLQDVHQRLIREREISRKLRSYRKINNDELFKQEEYDFYVGHLNEVTESLEKTIQNLKLHINSNENSN